MTPPANILSDAMLSPPPADMWGPYRPRTLPRVKAGLECMALAWATLGAFLLDAPSWQCDALGRWTRAL